MALTYCCVAHFISFFAGLIWSEIKQLWELGLADYLSDMWNILGECASSRIQVPCFKFTTSARLERIS